MKNIFNELPIPIYYINFSLYISDDLHSYLDDNLEDENEFLTRDLKNALTTNVNGKYI
jgi:hypothetical protein